MTLVNSIGENDQTWKEFTKICQKLYQVSEGILTAQQFNKMEPQAFDIQYKHLLGKHRGVDPSGSKYYGGTITLKYRSFHNVGLWDEFKLKGEWFRLRKRCLRRRRNVIDEGDLHYCGDTKEKNKLLATSTLPWLVVLHTKEEIAILGMYMVMSSYDIMGIGQLDRYFVLRRC